MKTIYILIGLLWFSLNQKVAAQSVMHVSKKGVTVHLTNDDPTLSETTLKRYVETFFKSYPKLRRIFNKDAIREVKIKIDTAYQGVAYAHAGQITIASQWMHKNPLDADLLTHEGMHLVQNYPNNAGPGWLVEGIADYARYHFGADNEAANWYLPEYQKGQHYTDAYRISARFLVWTSNNYNKNLVKLLDCHLRNKTYSPSLWEEYTGMPLDDLWEEYIQDPGIS